MTENHHEGLPVSGYQPQTSDNVDVVNYNKEIEERCLRRVDQLFAESSRVMDAKMAELFRDEAYMSKPLEERLMISRACRQLYDMDMLIRAKWQIQEAFMWMNRAVFQPSRVPLPEDADAQ